MPSLPYAKYLDRVLGAWMGAAAGAALGSKHSGQKDFAPVKFDPKALGKTARHDAIALAVLNIHALRERGPHLTSKALAEEWQQHFTSDDAGYGIAKRNWRLGIQPPASGRFNNDFFGESVGAAARAFAWGLVCPGATRSALRYARRDAELDHQADGIEAAMFVAALVAGTFSESDVETLVHTSLHQLDGGTRFARMVRDVLRWTGEKEADECAALVRSRYGTPDYSRVLVNLGFCLANLLRSKGSFEDSVIGVAGYGYDSARNGALVGAIAGSLAGAAKLPPTWRKAQGATVTTEEFLRGLPASAPLTTLAEETCRLGMEIGSVFQTGTEFVQVPPQVTVFEHNPIFLKVMDLFVDYLGAPSLRFGDERDVRLKLVSRNPRRMQGLFRLTAESGLAIRPDVFPLDLGPYETRTVDARIGCPAGARRLSMKNIVTATFDVGKQTLHEERFGVASSTEWLALGPFWQESRLKDKDAAWAVPFTQDAGFDTKWLPEPDVNEKTKPTGKRWFDRVIVHADGDIIPLDHVFPPTGPCTLYLVSRLHSPTDRQATVWLGSNDAVKLWVNRKPAAESSSHQFFTPFTVAATVKLKKGVNLLLLKVARSDRHFSVRIGFKEHDKKESFGTAWMTDLAFERLEA